MLHRMSWMGRREQMSRQTLWGVVLPKSTCPFANSMDHKQNSRAYKHYFRNDSSLCGLSANTPTASFPSAYCDTAVGHKGLQMSWKYTPPHLLGYQGRAGHRNSQPGILVIYLSGLDIDFLSFFFVS